MISAILLLVAAQTPGTVAAASLPQPDPKAMSRSEIREHNAKVAHSDPRYIRCVKSADTGSLVKRNLSCRTNHQWANADQVGNDEARIIADTMQSKFTNTN